MIMLFEIPGYDGKYKVSTVGDVYSYSNWSKGSILEVFTNRQGDKRVNLSINGKVKQYRIADLLKLTRKEANGST